MIRTILVPLDGSSTAESILPHAEALLGLARARLVLLCVCRSGERSRKAALNYLSALAAQRFPEADIVVATGTPAAEILRVARERSVDLIAMTTHARAGIKRLVYGSVAKELLRSSPTAIYLALPHVVFTPLRVILLPLDGSKRAEKILPAVGEIAKASGAEIRILMASPVEIPARLAARNVNASKRQLTQLGLTVTVGVHPGKPADIILGAADADRVDLVAMTTHGRSGLARLEFGSVTERVLNRTKVPLLVLRTEGPAASAARYMEEGVRRRKPAKASSPS